MRTTLIIACAIVVFAAGAQAQDALKPCRQIKEDGKRLKCYDRLDRSSSNARERLGQSRPGGDMAWIITDEKSPLDDSPLVSAALPSSDDRSHLLMCDYSLHGVRTRPAKVGEKLVTHNFGTGTRGFAAPEDCSVAVCLLPGTELAFDTPVKYQTALMFRTNTGHTVAIFRQINKGVLHINHDVLEFPDGEIVLLTRLCEGQKATVLTLPTQPKTAAEADAQRRVAHVG